VETKKRRVEMGEDEEISGKKKSGRLFLYVGIPLFVATLYDMLLKPGIGHISGLLLYLASLGNDTLINKCYSMAATDPSSEPALLILFSIVMIPSMVLGGSFANYSSARNIYKEYTNKKNVPKKIISGKEEDLKSIMNKLHIKFDIVSAILLSAFIIMFTAYNFVNMSILINRNFYANLRICAPYISDYEEEVIVAKFSSTKSKQDYINVSTELKGIAQQNGIELRNEKLW
jgi:hypothetical protein